MSRLSALYFSVISVRLNDAGISPSLPLKLRFDSDLALGSSFSVFSVFSVFGYVLGSLIPLKTAYPAFAVDRDRTDPRHRLLDLP